MISANDLIVDVVLKLSKFPKPEEVLLAEKMERHVGGAGNFLIVASRLGLKTRAVGCVGEDENGRFLVEELKKEGVDISGIVVKSGNTKATLVLVDDEGNKSFIGIMGEGTAILEPEDVNFSILDSSSLYFSGYSLAKLHKKWEAEAVLKIFRFCKDRMKIFFDPGPLISLIPKEILKEVIERSSVLLLNFDEARAITGLHSLEEISRVLSKMGAEVIVIKRGEKGSFVHSKEGSWEVSSFKVDVIDTTGAGDAFNAGFIFGYMQGWDFYSAALLANSIGALSVTKLGAGSQLPKKDEVIKFLQENKIKLPLT